MILSYLPRLLCLALACFAAVFAVATLIAAMVARRVVRFAEAQPPRRAAEFVLYFRLLPLGLAVCAALGLCVPSYLFFEPEALEEPLGWGCMALALAGFVLLCNAVVRGGQALHRSTSFTRRCGNSGQQKVCIIDASTPCLALTGFVRPRIVMSRGILNTLSEEELAVVVSHECAHAAAFDNFKRFLLRLAPGSGELERAWMRFAEYAADQYAVRGDGLRAVALASALVRVARLGQSSRTPFLATAFLAETSQLSGRVERLLARPLAPEPAHEISWAKLGGLASVCVLALNPASLRFVHSLLESLTL